MAGVLEETGTANPSITPEYTPVFGAVGVLVLGLCMSSSSSYCAVKLQFISGFDLC